ncbi:hypothetical protein GS484_26550 [Rhodococcus hoagii]|nr:hypothetical protein [Prescottella equi]
MITPLAAEIANAVCQSRADLQAPEMQPAVLAYARSEAQLELLTAYVDEHGAVTDAGELTSARKNTPAPGYSDRQPPLSTRPRPTFEGQARQGHRRNQVDLAQIFAAIKAQEAEGSPQ